MKRFNYGAILLLTTIGFASAQSLTTTKFAEVTSSIAVTNLTVGTLKYYSIGLSVSYPISLAPASYISATQLNTDFENAIAAYPTPADPQEAILSTAVLALIQKYQQMAGATLFALPIGQTIGGIAVPSGKRHHRRNHQSDFPKRNDF